MPAPSLLTLERLYASPSLSGTSPEGIKFSPDGRRLTFLRARAEDSSHYDLWQFDVETGTPSLLVNSDHIGDARAALSEEEKALRERKRVGGRSGLLEYHWGTETLLLVPHHGDLFLVDLAADPIAIRQLTDTDAFEYDTRVSPRGRWASFVRDGAVHAIDLKTGAEHRLTPEADPDKAISYGTAEFVAQEEMSRYTGYWWSPDENYLAYTQVDESEVDIVPRFDIEAEQVTVIAQRYPRAGRANARVSLFVRDMQTGESHRLLETGSETYLARVNWTASHLWIQTVNRDQTEITYHQAAIGTWSLRPGFTERHDTWVNLSQDFKDLGDGTVLISAELDQQDTDDQPGSGAFRHLIVLDSASGEAVGLTQGAWEVAALAGVNQAAGEAYFTAYRDTVLERHLYAVRFKGDSPEIRRVTSLGQTWSVIMAPDGQHFVGTASSPDQPPQTGLYRVDGTRVVWLEENRLDATHPYAPFLHAHSAPDFGTLQADDGQQLHYSLHRPRDFDPGKRYPVLVEVYGGPHVQMVDRHWERMTDQFYTHLGYLVFRLDNRGSAHRGKRFESVIYRRTGDAEVRDQLAGVHWLRQQSFVDPARIAIQGWSYGGYMTLMTLLQAPRGTFAAAVSGAPVTDWSLYDTFYTERYLDHPAENVEGYQQSSVFPYLDALETPLLLIHGMADDNVTFDNSTRLMAALQEKGKVFDLMTYPGQRHGIAGEKLRVHLMRTRLAFLGRHLGAAQQ